MTETNEAAQLYEDGAALMRQGDLKGAGEKFLEVLNQDQNFVMAHNAMGLVLAANGEFAEATECYDTAIRIDPNFASPYINKSVILHRLGRLDEALAALDRAIELDPDNPNANNNRGSILTELQRPQEAIASFNHVLAVDPSYPLAAGLRLLNKAQICDWNGITRDIPNMISRLDHNQPASPPWPLLSLADRVDLQFHAAKAWAESDCPASDVLGPIAPRGKRDKIRIGYYSADFYRHATAQLIVGLFEQHDRAAFEIYAFAFGPETGDDMQERVRKAVDHFIDVRGKTNREVAVLSRELGIDIAVDLKGITAGHRLGIFAHRAAPIQVNYLGYPGTIGASYMDYIIADKVVIPEDSEKFYTEEIVRLPYSYQANDSQRKVSEKVFTRAEVGLPEKGFVFCCFNNNFKIIHAVFDVWMNILHAVDGSVLWLIEDSPAVVENLRWEAERRGVDGKRLVFAPRIAAEEHLARQRLADLFLDTYPYNAHTTASDALWVGLPIITCAGSTFASRVCASLLTAMDLPELILPHFGEYEDLAVALAKDPARLAALREKIARNRETSPLFDSKQFARGIEEAYRRMIAARGV